MGADTDAGGDERAGTSVDAGADVATIAGMVCAAPVLEFDGT